MFFVFFISLQNPLPIDILLNAVFEKTDSDERNHTKQFRRSVAVNQNVKIEPGYFAIGFPRGRLLIPIPVRGRLYRRPKSPIKDHLLIKPASRSGRSRGASGLEDMLREWYTRWKNYSRLSPRRSEIASGCTREGEEGGGREGESRMDTAKLR